MERQNYILTVIILFFMGSTVSGSSRKSEIYEAYIGNNMAKWKSIIDEMENSKKATAGFLLELVNFQYGYIGYCLGNDNPEEAEEYLNRAKKNLKLLEQTNVNQSYISAYKSAFYGFSIGLNKIKAPFLGPKSVKHAKLAMQQNPENPMGYIQYGNSQFYMPPVFGGSKEEAVKHFKKAGQLMEKNQKKLQNDWNYLSLLALIGQSYSEMKEYKNAMEYYEKALKIEPGFSWVKKELIPQLQEKMK